MENKYYKPEIEDLNIGQEIWITNLDNYAKVHDNLPCKGIITELTDYPTVWVKTAKNSRYEIYPYMIEIKYLDKEDIESLGWKFTGKSIDTWFIMEGSFDMGSWTAYKAILHYGFHDQRLVIDIDDCGDSYTLFCGKCNNVSELKKLMKQIGINGK